MKPFRIIVLLLVALLLPLRGAVAASMDCADASMRHGHAGLPAAAAGDTPGHHLHHGQADASDGEGHHGDHHGDHPATHANPADPGGAAPQAPDGSSGDTCHLCASGCGVAALLMALPADAAEPPTAEAPCPGVALPALDFQLDGQDRPPRTR